MHIRLFDFFPISSPRLCCCCHLEFLFLSVFNVIMSITVVLSSLNIYSVVSNLLITSSLFFTSEVVLSPLEV